MCANPQHRQMEKLNKARGEASFQLASRMQRNRVSHSTDSMLSNIPEREESDSDTVLVDEVDDDSTWFELDGDQVENVQIYHEHNEGCIGEDDGPEKEGGDVEMGEQASESSADIEIDGKLAVNSWNQELTNFSRQKTGRLNCQDSEVHMQD